MLQLPTPILGKITALTITTPDFDRSLAFYAMLGFKEVARADWPFPWIQVSDGVLLIMLRKDTQPYLALTYFVATISKVVKDLEDKGIVFTETPGAKDLVKRYAFCSPDGVNIRLVGITDGFSQPPGPGMLQMPQEDYFDPSKYVNKECGLFGELAHPVADLKAAIDYWKLLGFTTLSEFTAPYPWAVMTDGLAAIGLHQTEHFSTPTITFFAADMRQKISKLKANGLANFREQSAGNIIIPTPEGQQIFLFQMGEETQNSQPRLADIEQTVIETKRLLLKEVNPDMLTKLLTTFGDDDIMSFLGLTSSEELETERSNFRLGLRSYRSTSSNFLIIEKSSGKRIGRIGFHTWYTQHARAEIGYDISDISLRQQGYMTEAMEALIDHGFRQMQLNRIEAFVGTRNEPSLRLMQRFGFTKEGLLRSHYCKNGIIEDSLCFSLLRSEYDLS